MKWLGSQNDTLCKKRERRRKWEKKRKLKTGVGIMSRDDDTRTCSNRNTDRIDRQHEAGGFEGLICGVDDG